MGGDLHEIVDAEQVGRLFVALALILPPICLLGGWWYGRRRGVRQGALYGLLIGLLAPLNWIMWRVYNAITDRVGLDTVRNLVINVVLFVVVGAVIGIGAGYALRRGQPPDAELRSTDKTQ